MNITVPAPTPPSNFPRWLVRAHARAARVGFVRFGLEASATTGAVAAAIGLSLGAWIDHGLAITVAVIAFAWVGLLTFAAVRVVLPWVGELRASRRTIRQNSTHDQRTGIISRQHFIQQAYREWERCRRYRSGAALLIVDIDRLEDIVEEYGRSAADAVVRALALTCDNTLRKPDLLGRSSGESSLILFLPHTDTLGAVDVAERVRHAVATHRMPWSKTSIRATVSVGVATLGDHHLSLNALIVDAEAALQVAQQAGRNCVRTAPTPPSRSGRSFPVMPN